MHEERLKALLVKTTGLVIVMTGAGVSAESGIPTFRGKEGYWAQGSRNYHPMELATREAFSRMPETVWAWYAYRKTVCNRAEPNAGHRAVALLEDRRGDDFLLLTQNVDGLHLRAGNTMERTYQIHGNIDFMRCFAECSNELYPIGDRLGFKAMGEKLTPAEVRALVCPRCGEIARPHVLWFDECYDEEHFRFHSSLMAAMRCELLVTVGSSGSTNLPNQVAARAQQARIIDVNPERTVFARYAEASGGMWLPSSASEGLATIAELLTGELV